MKIASVHFPKLTARVSFSKGPDRVIRVIVEASKIYRFGFEMNPSILKDYTILEATEAERACWEQAALATPTDVPLPSAATAKR